VIAQDDGVKYVLSYRAVPDFLPLAREHAAAHRAHYQPFIERGLLLMIGPMAEPADGDAMAVFSTREAAEEFVAGDPFVLNEVVAEWSIRAWSEVLVPDRA
jgi:uncharacterized protein YciI